MKEILAYWRKLFWFPSQNCFKFEPSDTIALNPAAGVILAKLQNYWEGS